ncbi:MAG: glycerate kinase [Christensenellales bacterium]|jgi:glycerate kinase
MRVVIAPDSYKGALSAIEIANAIEAGVLAADPEANVDKIPMADGGEGTVNTLLMSMGGKTVSVQVHDPLGRMVDSYYGITEDGTTAMIEMAAASGLPMLTKEERSPLTTTTYGTGELMIHALDAGCSRIIIGIGGSATNDGGLGMAQALGIVFRDENGEALGMVGGGSLKKVKSIDVSGAHEALSRCDIQVACDVNNPLCGPNGAAAVFGPQKGATPSLVAELDENLAYFAKLIKKQLDRDVLDVPGAGAAGGLGAGLMAFTNARLRPGIEITVEASRMSERIAKADLVFTGEGQTDFQTMYGKVPVGIGRVAKEHNVPVICLSGAIRKGYEEVYDHGVTAAFSIITKPMTLTESIENTTLNLRRAATACMRLMMMKK